MSDDLKGYRVTEFSCFYQGRFRTAFFDIIGADRPSVPLPDYGKDWDCIDHGTVTTFYDAVSKIHDRLAALVISGQDYELSQLPIEGGVKIWITPGNKA